MKPENEKKKTSPDFSSWGRDVLKANEETAPSKPSRPEGGLYVVATPIGNLGDITLRALWVLRAADVVLCEDTRVSGALLKKYGISAPLLSCHEHNEASRIDDILGRLEKGAVVALVSDAGTPLLSDPGFRLVQACRARGQQVVSLPGASAALAALSCAGLPSDRFLFVGFLPSKNTARKNELAKWSEIQATLIFYESPQRLAATLAEMSLLLGSDRPAAVCREMTKLFEEVRAGTLAELAAFYGAQEEIKGEVVLLVAQGPEKEKLPEEAVEELLKKALEKMSLRDAAAFVAEATGLKKSALYHKALRIKTH